MISECSKAENQKELIGGARGVLLMISDVEQEGRDKDGVNGIHPHVRRIGLKP